MKRKFLTLLFILAVTVQLPAQSGNGPYELKLFPHGLNFMPLKANNQEARIGVLYYTSNSNLKVDIGNAIDILSIEFPAAKSKLNFGIEFMGYALSTSFEGKRLQIDALDGFFGGNATFSKGSDENRLLGRFRIIHNSAHLVDGHYDRDAKQWIDNREPIPFTKDFGELTAAHEISNDKYLFKYYGGLSYSTLVRPSELKKYNFHLGLEFVYSNFTARFLDQKINIFTANHFVLNGGEKYIGNQQTLAGIKFGDWNDKGVIFYFSYYSGSDIFSNYFERKVSRFGIGFSVDFF